MRKLVSFPLSSKKSAFLDNASTSLKFKSVIKSISHYYKNYPFNPHSFSGGKDQSLVKKMLSETKEKIASFLNCNQEGIFFTPSASHSLNFLALSFSESIISTVRPTISIAKIEHSSNIYPWLKLNQSGKVNTEYIDLNDDFSISEESLRNKITSNTKIFSFCHVSNNTGTKNEIKTLVKIVREKSPNCLIILDGSQSISSEKPNIQAWDIDVFLFSCHKFYSSSGLAVMWMSERAKKSFPEILWGGGKDFEGTKRKLFEVGTLPVPEISGLHQAISIIETVDLEKLKIRRKKLRDYTIKNLELIKEIEIYNKESSDSIILFNFKHFHSQDVSNFLARNFVYTRAGDFCSPFLKEVVGVASAVRLSIALYNKKSEIDLFLSVLKNISFENII